jgi:hypothetical protein
VIHAERTDRSTELMNPLGAFRYNANAPNEKYTLGTAVCHTVVLRQDLQRCWYWHGYAVYSTAFCYVQLNSTPSEEKERSSTHTGGTRRGWRVQKVTASLWRQKDRQARARQSNGVRLGCLEGNCPFAAKPSL